MSALKEEEERLKPLDKISPLFICICCWDCILRSARATCSEILLPSSNSPPESFSEMSCQEEHGLSSNHISSNGSQQHKIESAVQAYPKSPSNDTNPKIPFNGNESRFSVGTKEKEYNYSLYSGSIEVKRVEDRNSRSIESGMI